MPDVSSLLTFAVFWDAQIIRWVVWVGLVVLTIALLLLIRTRWGQSQPLGKCVVLSLLAHLLLGIYATTVTIVTETVGSPDGKGIQVALVGGDTGGETGSSEPSDAETWNTITGEAAESPASLNLAPNLSPPSPAVEMPAMSEPERRVSPDPIPLPARATSPETSQPDRVAPPIIAPSSEPIRRLTPVKAATPIEVPQPKVAEAPPVPAPDPIEAPETSKASQSSSPPIEASAGGPKPDGTGAASTGNPSTGSSASPLSQPADATGAGSLAGPPAAAEAAKPLPAPFQWRMGNHSQVAKGQGVTPESEASVKAALKWLAANQSSSGRWEARRLGGGANRAADAEDRQFAGSQADVGITGLALLSFLAAGNTHEQGSYQTTVRRGLEYLMTVQDSSGMLAATASRFERMYCHAMATCALSEAYAMTHDDRLLPAVRRAIGYTIQVQDRASGGWRYQPGQAGDTSQLGWQVMALKSAELGGLAIPPETREGIQRFLSSVALGHDRGLACYQPNRPVVTRSMTAEALACRQFLGLADSKLTRSEASDYVLQELPGTSQTNLYFWYYATLGLHQLQGEPWQRWNGALQKSLLSTQRRDGDLAGSWDPDPVWGGCGGRAYSTALSALCLEVYYRFLPLHIEAAGREIRAK